MNFIEAVKAMEEGKKVRRKSWTSESQAFRYVYSKKKNEIRWADGNVYVGNLRAFQANDWEVVEKGRKQFDTELSRGYAEGWEAGRAELIEDSRPTEVRKKLSDNAQVIEIGDTAPTLPFYFEKDVKEAIKDIKDEVKDVYVEGAIETEDEPDCDALDYLEVNHVINKRLGERLI